jgi:predicted unusual protein kinase regulating ubiquinone biosynthesis (AarF/ABC1/UbiB family)
VSVIATSRHPERSEGSAVTDTAQLQAWRASRPTRFRATRAYVLTVRILVGYAWLRLWKPLLAPSLYNAKLVELHRRNSRRLTRAILELGGLFIKVGQLISILTNFLPQEFRAELEQLQDSVPARPFDEVEARLRKEFGNIDELFTFVDPVPIASASLAQVHLATTTGGRRVAVKVQHADIEEISRLDLRILGRVLGLIQLVVRVRGLESYHADISQLIAEELDFEREAQNIALIKANFSGNPGIRFPTVVPELSTPRVLTTEFVDGTKVTDFARLAEKGIDRPALAERILRAYCQMVFVDGVFHADPHPGNILVHDDGTLTFVDFGAVGRLAPNVKQGVPMLWDGVIRSDAEKIIAALHEMGMIARDNVADERVAERVIDYFQKRFLEQVTLESFALKDIQVDMRSRIEALADLRKLDVSFRNLSRAFQVPKEWVIFERASLLLLGLCTQIDPNMNPIKTVGPYLEEFVLGGDKDWKARITSSIREVALSAIAMPDKANRALDLANRGDLELQIPSIGDASLLLYEAAQQILFAFLAAVFGAFAYMLGINRHRLMAVGAWIVSAACLVAVAAALRRARAVRRKLGRGR